jgi:hypothetical protein
MAFAANKARKESAKKAYRACLATGTSADTCQKKVAETQCATPWLLGVKETALYQACLRIEKEELTKPLSTPRSP